MNRRQVVAWALYDFANSSFAAVIAATIYATYYAQVVVGNVHGEGDLCQFAVAHLGGEPTTQMTLNTFHFAGTSWVDIIYF